MITIPNGTLNRWDVIAIWMADHGVEKERDGKTILKKAKELEKTAARGPLGNYILKSFKVSKQWLFIDSTAAFQKFQEEQAKKKQEGKVNSAEQAEQSVNFMKVRFY